MSGHTPGPWRRGCIGAEAYWVGPDWDQPLVATVERTRDEAEANARLIAASPDLLAALTALLAANDHAVTMMMECETQEAALEVARAQAEAFSKLLVPAREAVAKAEGQQ